MPVPDINGAPPFADFEMLKKSFNNLVQKVNQLLVSLDSLNVVSLTAENVDTGTLNAGKVTIRSDLSDGAYIQIDGTGMTVNDGVQDVFKVDFNGHVTMTGATVQTTSSAYPRIEFNSGNNLIDAQGNSTDSVQITPDVSGTPRIRLIEDAGTYVGYLYIALGTLILQTLPGAEIIISSSQDLNLQAGSGYYVRVQDWDKLYSTGDSQNLQTALNAKANASAVTGTFYVATTSGGAANHAIHVTNGVIIS